MDGLILKINDDFLKTLEKRGLKVKTLKVRFLIRDVGRKGNRYVGYRSLAEYTSKTSHILNSSNYLCSAGDFPIIENIELVNQNLSFGNDYRWYNITESRKLVKRLDYDSYRADFYNEEIVRYENLMNELIDQYTRDIQTAIDVRLNSYVDPCYVDAGYVSPNSEPGDVSTLLFTSSRFYFTAAFPALSTGQNYTIDLNIAGNPASPTSPTFGFSSQSSLLSWVQTNWSNYGFWSITPTGLLQLTTGISSLGQLVISSVTLPELQVSQGPMPFTRLTTDQLGNPCDRPYLVGATTVYPNIKHSWKFRITCASSSVNSFYLNLSGDFLGVGSPYIKSCSIGSATLSTNVVTWNGTLGTGSYVDIEIAGDVTLGGKADVYLGSGGYAHHTPPGINTVNNQAKVPFNYSIIGSLVANPNYYFVSPTNTASILGSFETKTYKFYEFSNSGNNLLMTSLPILSGTTRQIRMSGLTIESIQHYNTPGEWSKPMSQFCENVNDELLKLGYVWGLVCNNSTRTQTIMLTTYYDFSNTGASTQWQADNDSNGTVDQTYNSEPGNLPLIGVNYIYPNITSSFGGNTINDVYFS